MGGMCLSFIGISRDKEPCEPFYRCENVGWVYVFAFYDTWD